MVIYTTDDGLTKVEATFDSDTVWLSIDQMAELFQRDKSTISRHIKNVFTEGELNRDSVVANYATTAADGKKYQVYYYNLDVIISVGYRVKSVRGTQFRIWATGILKEYMKKGFAMDDERLKGNGGGNYWKELLDRIRDSDLLRKCFTGRFLTFTLQVLTMIRTVKILCVFSQSYRINYILQRTDILRPKLSMNVQMQISRLWA